VADAVTIRDLRAGDRTDFIEVMALAFEQDPLFLKAFGARGQGRSERAVGSFLSFMFDMNRLIRGTPRGLFVDGRLAACALLEPCASPFASAIGGIASALRFLPVAIALPLGATAFLNAYTKRTRDAAPQTPHGYLVMVGVLPQAQGRGFGKLLVEDAIERTRGNPRATGIALDTENEANVRLYERWGFRRRGSLDLGGVHAHCMFLPLGEPG
jgi:ribosomal protein S18 acetylase RimI-like enzyme